ncbi:hypothetical protein [Paenibacillus sp. USHLN196]|uniref:hypothetical protein n=1 Tax=Paenibacillus sp. USHLN196 TaxID=3081291 RepID=UPI003016CCE2
MSEHRLIQRIELLGNEEEDFREYVSELLEFNKLDGDEVLGIAKQIVSKGVESLSGKQLYVFAKHGIYDHLYVEECKDCLLEIPWSEMLQAAENYRNHLYCQHKNEKDE